MGVVHAVRAMDAEGGRVPVPRVRLVLRHSFLSSSSARAGALP
jgi:hypothetical protein